MPKLFTSNDLNGLAGGNGERFCVFIRNWSDPLNSVWVWFHTEQDARECIKRIKEGFKDAEMS